MSEWQPIGTAPMDATTIRVRLSDGREADAEYWSPPPLEIDPELAFGGWAICLIGGYGLGLDCGEVGDPVLWMPLPEPPK